MTAISIIPAGSRLPALVRAADERTRFRFLEFFTAQIRNPNTRRAYGKDVSQFFEWCQAQGVHELSEIHTLHVAAYVELLTKSHAAPTVKRHVAAIRRLFDWLVTGQVLSANPALSVRPPKHSQRRGKTQILESDEARVLLDAVDTDTLIGLRDRALISLMLFALSRIGAAITMKVEDVYMQRHRLWVRLHEKGGKVHEMPCHHTLEAALHAWLDASGLRANPKAALFPSCPGRMKADDLSWVLAGKAMTQPGAYQMMRRRAAAAGISAIIGNHSLRGTGITAYLKNGGTLEKARDMANHASTTTTQLYDRRSDDVTLDEVERIII
ncbi:tyrosine-type recombinase/integrase [Ancylobacter sonchi]|uniref:tyrosine-type recombinase/integrase n=1 Tax=Ancylobacter sonchi TaxID=1937790 RepID=UPI001BD4B383|nr:tyrosine-type recombinase/integrase [Ancylobacter sonchi]MBS7532286.1 tyrosine-type recombinase/integrase [Ancylobacter sonchi]